MLRRLLDSPWLYFGLAVLAGVVAIFSQVELGPAGPRAGGSADLASLREPGGVSLVFVLIDGLRADRLGSYGSERGLTPQLDRLASRGIRFGHATAQSSWARTSMASLWTATYPARNGVLRRDHRLPDQALLASEVLAEHGFHTAGRLCNRWLAADFGFAQGFESYLDLCPAAAAGGSDGGAAESSGAAADQRLTQSALEFLGREVEEPFLLYLHYSGIQGYAPRSEAFAPALLERYDAAVGRVDAQLGELLRALDEGGLRSRTLVVVASDHGEELGEHGQRGSARTLYREVLEVPLLLELPLPGEAGVVVPGLVQNVDIWPTLLDLLGLPPLPEADGRSLAPLVEAALGGQAVAAEARASFAQLDRNWDHPEQVPAPLVALTRRRFHLIEEPGVPRTQELFDHRTDPHEQRNAAALEPELAQELRAAVQQYLAEPAAPWSSARVGSLGP